MSETISSKSMKNSVWKELFLYTKKYKKIIVSILIATVFLALLDAIISLMIQFAIDEYIEKQNIESIWKLAMGFFALALSLGLSLKVFILKAGEFERKLLYDFRKDAFNNLQRLSFDYYDNNATGWTISKVTADIAKISDRIAWGFFDFLWGIFFMTTVAIVLFVYDAKLAIITLSIVPILLIVSIFFQRKLLHLHRDVRKMNSKITGLYNDGITGAKTSKTLVREDLNISEFKEATQEMNAVSVNAATYGSMFMPLISLLGTLGLVITLVFGNQFLSQGLITVGILIMFLNYTRRFYDPVLDIASLFTEIISSQAAAERVFALINEKSTIEDLEKVIEKYGTIESPKKENWESIKGRIEFRNVDFHYKEDEKILEDFNLIIEPGQTVALVGETGSGKSTLVNLACRFYEPKSGQILIDDKDYKDRSQLWLHSNIGYVLQSPHLFSGTIKENIMYAKPDATDEEVIAASKLVKAHDFIMDFEDGYDTKVGEGGDLLSTGQKQLISFARAMIIKPQLFFLDEATSSIDTETEILIQEAIDNALENRTSIVVAHRLSTIRNADKIIVMSNGKIIEQGNHQSLIKQKGHYHDLYMNQYKEDLDNHVVEWLS